MKWKALVAAASIATVLGASSPVPAQPYGRNGPPFGPGPFKKGPPPQQVPARQEGGERAAPPPQQQQPFGRLSPEERGQLRRDIERHGREIYPDPRRERRR